MPSGVFKPYAGVSTAILVFTKTGAGGTEKVWFYDMKADGFSLDDKRQPVQENDIPDIVRRYHNREEELERKRTEQSFFVDLAEIRENDYDLSINKYKEIEYEAVHYDPPLVILDRIEKLEEEIRNMANSYKMEPDQVKERLGDNEKAKQQLLDDLAVTKAADFVVREAKEA